MFPVRLHAFVSAFLYGSLYQRGFLHFHSRSASFTGGRRRVEITDMLCQLLRCGRAYLIRVTGTSTRWITLVATEPITKLAIGPRPRVPMMIASHCVSWTCRAISLAGEPTRERTWY